MTGRPSLYTADLAAEIFERLACGESLRSICRDDHMPIRETVLNWVGANREGFFDRYVRARELQAEHYADEIIGIADDGTNDWIETEDGPALNHEHVQRSKLRVEARFRLMGKLAPKRYGDRLQTENKTTIAAADPLTALLEQIAESGAKVHDPRPSKSD